MKSLLILASHTFRAFHAYRPLSQMQTFQSNGVPRVFQTKAVKTVAENAVVRHGNTRNKLRLCVLVAVMALSSFASQPLAAQFNVAGTITGTADPVTLNVTGSLTGTFFSGAGSYILTAFPNGTYTITPSLTGYTFTPTSRTVTVAGANVTGADFTATLIGGPSITSFAPTAGPVGTTISIFGNNLTGTTQVSFGGVFATVFTNISATQVNAVLERCLVQSHSRRALLPHRLRATRSRLW
jgi:hypothetical protein